MISFVPSHLFSYHRNPIIDATFHNLQHWQRMRKIRKLRLKIQLQRWKTSTRKWLPQLLNCDPHCSPLTRIIQNCTHRLTLVKLEMANTSAKVYISLKSQNSTSFIFRVWDDREENLYIRMPSRAL